MAEPNVSGSWDDIYRLNRAEELPWFSPRVDPDELEAIQRLGISAPGGPVLDLGTGPGTFAIEFARRGFDVVAADISPHAIELAKRRAGPLSTRIEWIARDLFACDWPSRFQLVHDRGVYHSMERVARDHYARLVPTWLRPGGILLIKTFSPAEPGDWGPYRIPRSELRENFGNKLDVVELKPTVFGDTKGPQAWRLVLRAK